MKRADQDSSKEVIRVMMVDDDDLNNMIHKILFKKAKVTSELEVFLNGADAVKYLSGRKPSEWPQLIFLDLNMPVLDGWGVLEKITLPHPHVHLYILSSSIDPVEIQRAKSYPQVKGFLSKPLSSRHLDEVFSKWQKEHKANDVASTAG